MELNGRYPSGTFTTARNLTGMEDPQQLTEHSVLPRGIASLTPDSSRFSRCGSSSLCFCIRKEMSVAFHAGIKKNPSEFLQLTTILMQRRHPLLQVWQKWHPQKATLYALGYKKLPCSFSCTKRRPPPYWRRQVWQPFLLWIEIRGHPMIVVIFWVHFLDLVEAFWLLGMLMDPQICKYLAHNFIQQGRLTKNNGLYLFEGCTSSSFGIWMKLIYW